MQIRVPDSRLQSAIPYLKSGGFIVDVGTDHAHLPIYLVQIGAVRGALACDVNEGPLCSARKHIADAGLSDRITTLRTDGLHGVEPACPDDILIFGMGGELIVRILSEAPWIRKKEIGLILQPMSRASVLRAWLIANGFSILGETLTREEKIYQTIYARWSGQNAVYTEEELILGKYHIEHPTPLFSDFVQHELRVWKAIRAGKACGTSGDTREEDRMIDTLTKRLEALS